MRKPLHMLKQVYRESVKINFIVLLVVAANVGHAQVRVVGPDCVIAGKPYQYILKGQWDSTSKLRMCVTGGKLVSGETCTPGVRSNAFFVVWGDTEPRRIDVTSSIGNDTRTISGTTELTGGELNEGDKTQVYDSTRSTYQFRCSVAAGGSCLPSYKYQWQQSENGLKWSKIPGATGKDLEFSGKLLVNTYFRRVTTETGSKTMVYSDSGMIMIDFRN